MKTQPLCRRVKFSVITVAFAGLFFAFARAACAGGAAVEIRDTFGPLFGPPQVTAIRVQPKVPRGTNALDHVLYWNRVAIEESPRPQRAGKRCGPGPAHLGTGTVPQPDEVRLETHRGVHGRFGAASGRTWHLWFTALFGGDGATRGVPPSVVFRLAG